MSSIFVRVLFLLLIIRSFLSLPAWINAELMFGNKKCFSIWFLYRSQFCRCLPITFLKKGLNWYSNEYDHTIRQSSLICYLLNEKIFSHREIDKCDRKIIWTFCLLVIRRIRRRTCSMANDWFVERTFSFFFYHISSIIGLFRFPIDLCERIITVSIQWSFIFLFISNWNNRTMEPFWDSRFIAVWYHWVPKGNTWIRVVKDVICITLRTNAGRANAARWISAV